MRRILFNEPDFVNQKSELELLAESRGYKVLFLPKFHCELNFIEQVWGYAKRKYRLYPPSSDEGDLEKNVKKAMEEVPLITMRRWVFFLSNTEPSSPTLSFASRSFRFMDAYERGLNGNQAAWAAKKYRGHRTVSENILEEFVAAEKAVAAKDALKKPKRPPLKKIAPRNFIRQIFDGHNP